MVRHIYRVNYPSYYKYQKEIKSYRDMGYIIRNVYGGVAAFATLADLKEWEKLN